MASLPRFTVREYNNCARMDDVEHATYLLTQLEQDTEHLLTYLDFMHDRYAEGVPQATCDDLAEIANRILDRLRNVDPAYQAECERRAKELHDDYLVHVAYTAEHNHHPEQGGYCG